MTHRRRIVRDDFGGIPRNRKGKEPYITVKLTEKQRAVVDRVARDLGGLSVSDAVRFMIHAFTGYALKLGLSKLAK